VNSGAIKTPSLIGEAAKKYGNQCVVLSMDVKRVDGVFTIFAKGGRENTGIDAVEWAKRGEADGAGELVVNSIDTDGVKNGFDLEMLTAIGGVVSIPVIASGGAGNMEHFLDLFRAVPQVDAGLAASIFHFREVRISDLKRYLRENGVPARVAEG
jgi:cyclase